MSESPLYIDNVGLMLARHTSLLGHWGNIGSMWVRERGDVFVYIILINDVKFFKFSEEGHCCPPCPPCQKGKGGSCPPCPHGSGVPVYSQVDRLYILFYNVVKMQCLQV